MMTLARACGAWFVLAVVASGCNFDLHSIPSVEDCEAAGLTNCGSSANGGSGGNAGNSGGIGGSAGNVGGIGGVGVGGIGGVVGGIGGVGISGAGGVGISGAGGEPIDCGGTVCAPLATNPFVQLQSCCFMGLTCGAADPNEGRCIDAFDPGPDSAVCPSDAMGLPISGCCRTDGRCGFNGSLIGVGCVAREEMPASFGGPRNPISCGGGDPTASWLPPGACRDCVESYCSPELSACDASCRDFSTCAYQQCGDSGDPTCLSGCGLLPANTQQQYQSVADCRTNQCSGECTAALYCSLQNNPTSVYLAQNASVQCSRLNCSTVPAPLPDDAVAATYWDPCAGGPFVWTANGDFESPYDWLCVGGLAERDNGCACGTGTGLTGVGPWSGTATGPVIVGVASDGSINSPGLSYLSAMCAGPPPF